MEDDKQTLLAQTAISWLKNSSKVVEPLEIKLASLHYLSQLYLFLSDYEKAEETIKKLPTDIGLDFASNLLDFLVSKYFIGIAVNYRPATLY